MYRPDISVLSYVSARYRCLIVCIGPISVSYRCISRTNFVFLSYWFPVCEFSWFNAPKELVHLPPWLDNPLNVGNGADVMFYRPALRSASLPTEPFTYACCLFTRRYTFIIIYHLRGPSEWRMIGFRVWRAAMLPLAYIAVVDTRARLPSARPLLSSWCDASVNVLAKCHMNHRDYR